MSDEVPAKKSSALEADAEGGDGDDEEHTAQKQKTTLVVTSGVLNVKNCSTMYVIQPYRSKGKNWLLKNGSATDANQRLGQYTYTQQTTNTNPIG